jgi:hypothetical protein
MTWGESLQCRMVRIRVSQCPTGGWRNHQGTTVLASCSDLWASPSELRVATSVIFLATCNSNTISVISIWKHLWGELLQCWIVRVRVSQCPTGGWCNHQGTTVLASCSELWASHSELRVATSVIFLATCNSDAISVIRWGFKTTWHSKSFQCLLWVSVLWPYMGHTILKLNFSKSHKII